jgi:hypothetical protein
LIMKEINIYGAARFRQGFQDATSRMRNRPGNGDMGG